MSHVISPYCMIHGRVRDPSDFSPAAGVVTAATRSMMEKRRRSAHRRDRRTPNRKSRPKKTSEIEGLISVSK